MVATPITKSARFVQPGITVVYFAPIMADYNSPTRAELNAGTNLSREVAGMSTWAVTSDSIETPDLVSRFVSRIPSTISVSEATLSFYLDKLSVDARGIFTRDTTGYIVWLDTGDVAGRMMDVFPVQVASAAPQRSLTDPAKVEVTFTVTAEPAELVVVPA